jgi:hypothetical protein
VPARDQQGDARLGQGAVFELVDGHVGGQVVDAVQRHAQAQRVRLGGGDADEQRAGQAGSRGHRDRVDVGETQARALQGPLDGGGHRLKVRPGGDLGHHPAEAGVLLDAGGDRVGQQGVPLDDAHPCLVTGGLDAQDQRFVTH